MTDTILVKGLGPERTTIDAGGDAGVNDRVFDVHAPGKKLTLRGLTVTGGSPDTFHGGGIQVLDGSLRLETCVVSGNEILNGQPGSAVQAFSADLTEIVDSWITGNTGSYSTVYLGVARIERTTVSGNTSLGYAEALSVSGGNSLLLDSTVSGHVGGGGLTIWGTGTEVTGCTLADNAGPAFAIASSSSATMSNTLVVGNCGQYLGQLTTLGGTPSRARLTPAVSGRPTWSASSILGSPRSASPAARLRSTSRWREARPWTRRLPPPPAPRTTSAACRGRATGTATAVRPATSARSSWTARASSSSRPSRAASPPGGPM